MNAILPFRHQMPTMHSILHNRQSGSYHAFHPSLQVVRQLPCIPSFLSGSQNLIMHCIPSFLTGSQVDSMHSILPFRLSGTYQAFHPSFQVVRTLSGNPSFLSGSQVAFALFVLRLLGNQISYPPSFQKVRYHQIPFRETSSYPPPSSSILLCCLPRYYRR